MNIATEFQGLGWSVRTVPSGTRTMDRKLSASRTKQCVSQGFSRGET
jgi:hypothetical protein